MISIERTKELMDDPAMSDAEATELRDYCRAFAELMFEQWQNERQLKRQKQNGAISEQKTNS